MKLLIVSQWFPCPPVNGGRQRVYHLLRGLVERHDIHLLSFTQDPSDMEHVHELGELCGDVVVVKGNDFKPTAGNAVRALFSMRPRSSIDCWSKTMAEMVEDQLNTHSFDAAIAFTTRAGEYLMHAKLPKILDNDNVDTAYFARLIGQGGSPLAKFRRKLTWVKVARHEQRLVAAFDAVTAVSEEDRRELAKLLPAKNNCRALHVVPNGVDLGLMDYKTPDFDPKRIISTGALTYHANYDAAVFFCERILPGIKKAIPDAGFVITGGHKGMDISPFTAAGAALTGFLDDIRPLVAGSAVLVVPLRIGGGTRLKILEAMALGTPVVATTLGAAGIGVRHGETALIADDPDEFADCVIQLMKDSELRAELTKNAREHVAARFGWDRSAEAMEYALKSITGQGRER
ncbi:MAG: glycosyltransferase family 4 protein [Armatimonadota bacterium]